MDPGDVVDELVSAAVVQVRGCLLSPMPMKPSILMTGKPCSSCAERTSAGTADIETVNAERFDGEVGVGPRAQYRNIARMKPKRASFRKLG